MSNGSVLDTIKQRRLDYIKRTGRSPETVVLGQDEMMRLKRDLSPMLYCPTDRAELPHMLGMQMVASKDLFKLELLP